jgi:hypothetical protein
MSEMERDPRGGRSGAGMPFGEACPGRGPQLAAPGGDAAEGSTNREAFATPCVERAASRTSGASPGAQPKTNSSSLAKSLRKTRFMGLDSLAG